MEERISVVINTYNAAETLEDTLKTVGGFDEVVVCDMESTDDTVAIATRYGCKVVTFPKGDIRIVEPARDFAVHSATHEWVLVVDADELVPNELRAYLYNRTRQGGSCPAGLFIPRKNSFMGRFMHATYPDYQLRFLRKDNTRWPATIHSLPEVDGNVEKLPRSRRKLALVHKDPNTIASRLKKLSDYSDYEVEKKLSRRYGAGSLLWRPFFMFIKAYCLKGGWRDGLPGLMWAGFEAFYQFTVVSKCIEKTRQTPHSIKH